MPINAFDYIDRMFLTIIVIVGITALLYRVMGRFNKPMVLGGVLAGLIITSLHLPKEYFDLDSCSGLGDMGIIFFMMLLGSRFDFAIINERKANILISLFSIIFPFAGGAWFAKNLYYLNASAVVHIKFPQFALLIGLTMSIAAFALVSLFLSHAHLLHKKISHLALLAASIDEVFYWLIFAFVLLYFQTNNILKVSKSVIFSCYMLGIIFIFPSLVKHIVSRIRNTRTMLGFLIIGCFISAVLADAVNLHQIFGGFVFGLMLPRNNRHIIQLRSRIEDFITVLLLPIFFAKIGAVADISIITNTNILWLAIIVTLISFVGKFSGVFISGKILGYKHHETAFLASVLNIRGVVEVVMMKVVWEVGIISLQIFTILILMALTSTWIATTSALYFKKFLVNE